MSKTLIFVDACIRGEGVSRTKRLCDSFLKGATEWGDISVERLGLSSMELSPMTRDTLNLRDKLIADCNLNAERFDLAHKFANADYIVIGAPYWDLSFPAALKTFIENIMVTGITFSCRPDGGFVGLCRAEKLVYITTAGGIIGNKDFGYEYICAIAEMVGIKSTTAYYADCLDIDGMDVERIMQEKAEELYNAAKNGVLSNART